MKSEECARVCRNRLARIGVGGNLLKAVAGVVLLCAAASLSLSAQTFTSLHSFAGTTASDGAFPGWGPLVQGLDGNLYGTTVEGGTTCSFEGAAGCGAIFKITPAGSTSIIYKFCAVGNCLDGLFPEGGLTLNTDGSLYGMTDLGGSVDVGTIFRTSTKGVLSTLYSFNNGTIGSEPLDTLLRASNGNFYGTTQAAGGNGDGALFKINQTGVPTWLQNFDNATIGGAQGDPAGLIEGTDGNFYGVASVGGTGVNPVGTVFMMSPKGAVKVLHTFTGSPDGREPEGTLVLGTDGNFYGTTSQGGATDQGTIFRITPSGFLTILYNFCTVNGCPDGFSPRGGLIQGTDGNFYGTTLGGGTGGAPGTVFQFTSAGTLITLHSFSGLDGSEPFAPLVQHTNGTFYGTTNSGGINGGVGTVFSISLGLTAFVRTLPGTGSVGSTVKILGTNLTVATGVSFNGVSATFTVVPGGSEIKTTVPAGATTGFVTVTTPTGTLTSNVQFVVH